MTYKTDITKNNFFAWSLYTAYRNPVSIGNWVAAEWPGKSITNSQDMQDDIDFRIDMFIEALKTAISCTTNCNHRVRYFVVPEFYFHSVHGPYPGLTINDQSAFDYLMNQLAKRIKGTLADSSDSGGDWVICTGSVLTTHVDDITNFLARSEVQKRLTSLNEVYARATQQNKAPVATSHIGLMRLKSFEAETQLGTQYDELNALVDTYRQNPLCTVRNRAGIFAYNVGSTGEITRYSIEKQAESTVDLTLGILQNGKIKTGGQITEWMANYPPISILNGDNQGANTGKTGARMSINSCGSNVELGAEICLDHRLQRLRRTVNMPGNCPLDIQLVSSGGMQLLNYAIAGGSSGAIFNTDGCDYILDQYNSSGQPVITKNGEASNGTTKKVITGVYTSSAQTRSKGADGTPYYSHSQLAFRTADIGPSNYVNPVGTENLGGVTYTGDISCPANQYLDLYSNTVVQKVSTSSQKVNNYFTAGLGEIHQYSPA